MLNSLRSRQCDAKDVVAQILDILYLNQESLEQLEPETKHLIRNIATVVKKENRLDVLECLREIVPAGTTGES